MSWLSKALGFVRPALGTAAALPLPGPIGVATKVAAGIGAIGIARKAARVLPGVGAVAGATVAGEYVAGKLMGTSGRRRRGKGFSARDVRQTKRLMKMLKEVQGACPKPRTTSSRRSCSCQ